MECFEGLVSGTAFPLLSIAFDVTKRRSVWQRSFPGLKRASDESLLSKDLFAKCCSFPGKGVIFVGFLRGLCLKIRLSS